MTAAAHANGMHRATGSPWPMVILLAAAILVIQAAGLWFEGQPLIAKSGTVELWHGANDAGQSQHIADWYTLTHIEHGLVFYLVLVLLFPRMPAAWRFLIAVCIEGAWELFENSAFIIDRYRQSNLAQGYRGDTIVNSISDNIAMMAGFLVASMMRPWGVLALFLALEAVLALGLRDNLILNVITLVHPIEVIEQWQAGGRLGS